MLAEKKELLRHLNRYGSDTMQRLSWENDEFRNNIKIVLAYLEIDGFQLEYASEQLRDNKEVVLTAINQDGAALRYASERFKNDKEMVLLAIKNKAYRYFNILECIGEELINDDEIIVRLELGKQTDNDNLNGEDQTE